MRRNRLRHLVTRLQVGPADLNIDRRRRSHVHHCVYQAAGREVGCQLGHLIRQAPLDTRDIQIAAETMSRSQANLNKAGMHGGVRRVDRGEAVIDANVIDNGAKIGRTHNLL